MMLPKCTAFTAMLSAPRGRRLDFRRPVALGVLSRLAFRAKMTDRCVDPNVGTLQRRQFI